MQDFQRGGSRDVTVGFCSCECEANRRAGESFFGTYRGDKGRLTELIDWSAMTTNSAAHAWAIWRAAADTAAAVQRFYGATHEQGQSVNNVLICTVPLRNIILEQRFASRVSRVKAHGVEP